MHGTWTRGALVAWLLAVVGLPIVGTGLRRSRADRCALDGVRIIPAYAVRVIAQERAYRFCCIDCAETYLARSGVIATTVYVTDEVSGRELDATLAHFVRSLVVTVPTTGNRTHAFGDRSDAQAHATAFRGTLLIDSERPFWNVPGATDHSAIPVWAPALEGGS